MEAAPGAQRPGHLGLGTLERAAASPSAPAKDFAMDEDLLVINDAVSIPLVELNFRFSRSSGPGGQHVQKSSTRVE